MSTMAQSGFTVGMVSGGLVGLGLVASKAVDNAVAHAHAASTVQRWSVALDAQRLRAIRAERALIRANAEIDDLRARLQDANYELDILRNA